MRPFRFVKLSRSAFLQMVVSGKACEMYLDLLTLMDDLLCEFVPDREPPRQDDADSVVDSITKIQAAISGYTTDEVETNIAENFATAKTLRNEALNGSATEDSNSVRQSIENFLASLLEQYMLIAQVY